jgi:hypothetical protein
VKRECITLHPTTTTWIKELGGGNLSKGIRLIIEDYHRYHDLLARGVVTK